MERPERPRFYFDYVDPLSYLAEIELTAAVEAGEGPEPVRIPLELRPPPAPLLDPDGPWWRARWQSALTLAAACGDTTVLVEPRVLPWTRKAHELVAHARASGLERRAHMAVFEALFARGEDIGRVDVLVRLAASLGLDATETKAVLDVDRYAQDVATVSAEAAAAAGRASGPHVGPPGPPGLPQPGRGAHLSPSLKRFPPRLIDPWPDTSARPPSPPPRSWNVPTTCSPSWSACPAPRVRPTAPPSPVPRAP